MADGLTGEQFAQGLGSGFLGIWSSIGNNFNSTANFNTAVANQINANAGVTAQSAEAARKQQEQEQKTIVAALVILALIPITIILLTKGKKKA